MKYLIIVLTLLFGSAHAKDVMYFPIFAEQTTGLPATIFFTNEESLKCPKGMMYSKLVAGYNPGKPSGDGKILNELCWQKGNDRGLLLLNLSNNQLITFTESYGVVQGSMPEFATINAQWLEKMMKASDAINKVNRAIIDASEQARDDKYREDVAYAAAKKRFEPKSTYMASDPFTALSLTLPTKVQEEEAIMAEKAKKRSASLADCWKHLGVGAPCGYSRSEFSPEDIAAEAAFKKEAESKNTHINKYLYGAMKATPIAIVMDIFSIKPDNQAPKAQVE